MGYFRKTKKQAMGKGATGGLWGKSLFAGLCLLVFLLAQGCSHHVPLKNGIHTTGYQAAQLTGSVLEQNAPVFLARGTDKEYNRIGTPKARLKDNGEPEVYVDPATPAFFVRKTEFTTSRDKYTNLVYRIHFSRIPHSLIPFTLTAGKNAGLLVIVTLDSQEQPVLVTTVHTCGCYLSIIPTKHLPRECLPADWEDKPKKVYGEKHPPLLDYSPDKGQRLLVELRPEIHRVMDVVVVDESSYQAWGILTEDAPMVPAEKLEGLEIDGYGPVSFFHETGMKTGFVKGSIKPWETLLMSWMALDLFVGSDKAYSPMAEEANPFYTSLKPWNRQKSNMWRFDEFLKFWGYDL